MHAFLNQGLYQESFIGLFASGLNIFWVFLDVGGFIGGHSRWGEYFFGGAGGKGVPVLVVLYFYLIG